MDSLNCPICLEFCREAMECHECHNVFCKACSYSALLKQCPLCRKDAKFLDAHFARRLINSLATKCKNCELEMTIGDLNTHKDKCEQAPITCLLCKDILKKSHFFDHLLGEHLKEISGKLPQINELLVDEKQAKNEKEYSIKSQRNKVSGLISSLGRSGKYYCGGKLDGEKCECCDGICGPLNGCNCSGCMQLDIESRRLPKGWLVNTDGFAASKSKATELFYCGRKIITSMPNSMQSISVCGPDNGPNCKSCQRLDATTKDKCRYARFL